MFSEALLALSLASIVGNVSSFSTASRPFGRNLVSGATAAAEQTTRLNYGDAKGDYYGESGSSFMVKEFSTIEQLENIVDLSSKPLPNRPDGIVCVAKYTAAQLPECKATEAGYELLARSNPATVFLRSFLEYDGAKNLYSQAEVSTLPTFDIFYGGHRVARVEGSNYGQVEEVLARYQFANSKMDFFSEEAGLAWDEGTLHKMATETPRTSNRFVPGYDWDKDRGYFDDLGDQFQYEWDKIYGDYGEWLPNMEDE